MKVVEEKEETRLTFIISAAVDWGTHYMVLFSAYDLSDVLRTHDHNMVTEIDSMDGDRLLNTDIDELCKDRKSVV